MLHWIIFLSLVLILLALDLNIFNAQKKAISFKKSLLISSFYIVIALIFGIWILYNFGRVAAENYLTVYLIEKILSLDNIFIISLIFTYLNVPTKFQHRVLFWGILGVVVFRGIMIGFGATLVQRFEFILYIFGAFLVATGIKMLILSEQKLSLQGNIVLSFIEKYFNVSKGITKEKFLILRNNKLYITRLTVALISIEIMDLIFAIDSVPASLAVTHEIYIVYTANILAIMGLRALYFCLDGTVKKFYYLKYSLAIVLIFIGVKIFLKHFIHISTSFSLITTIVIIGAGIVISVLKSARKKI